MKTNKLSFNVPAELIAQYPPEQRGQSRLLLIPRDGTAPRDHTVAQLPDLIEPGTLMVFNNTRVRNARVYAERAGGAQHQLLLTDRITGRRWRAIADRAKKLQAGVRLQLPDGSGVQVVTVDEPYREIRFDRPIDDTWLERYGHVPLPPYMRRDDEAADRLRYQTMFAKIAGSAAAPTASLHFTQDLLDRLAERRVHFAELTLHVGIGTFLPIRSERIEDHTMHQERYYVSPLTADAVAAAKRAGRPVLAVGTTVVRTLESAWDTQRDAPVAGHGSTDLFIYPGYRFRAVDQIFTNLHTPESSLAAMIAAFTGTETLLAAYRHAVDQRYRFFSYGDASLLR